jgi:hypothetical protein
VPIRVYTRVVQRGEVGFESTETRPIVYFSEGQEVWRRKVTNEGSPRRLVYDTERDTAKVLADGG